MIGADLKAYRSRRNLTVADLAKLAGITQTALKKYERGAAIPDETRDRFMLIGVREDEL